MLFGLWLHVATAAPSIPRLTAGDVTTRLQNAGDRPLVVNFFATWCGGCVSELPVLLGALAAHPEVSGLIVSLDDDRDHDRLAQFMADHGVNVPVVHLQGARAAVGTLIPDWPDRIPVTLVIAPGGAERSRLVGTLVGSSLEEALRPSASTIVPR